MTAVGAARHRANAASASGAPRAWAAQNGDGGGRSAAVQALLQLALGQPLRATLSRTDWERVLARAVRERCAGIAWLRSRQAISTAAPEAVVARWRSQAITLDNDGERRLECLTRVVRALTAAGVQPVVLKGAPLSERAYGDPHVRPSSDIDLYCDPAERLASESALLALGAVRSTRQTAGESAFVVSCAGHRQLVELHSRLIDDCLLHHIPLRRPDASETRIGMTAVPAHCGPSLPVYLACHLAKHRQAPLLWLLDLEALWSRMSATDRRATTLAAGDARVSRILAWALAWVEAVRRAAHGDPTAGARFARNSGRWHRGSPLVRLCRLADTPLDAARVVANRVMPFNSRRGARRRLDGFARRWTATLLGESFAPASGGLLLASDCDLCSRVRGALRTPADRVWIRCGDRPPRADVPAGGAIRLRLPSPPVRPGRVVLARRRDGAPILGRVVGRGAEGFTLGGPMGTTAVGVPGEFEIVAVADAVVHGDRPVSLEPVRVRAAAQARRAFEWARAAIRTPTELSAPHATDSASDLSAPHRLPVAGEELAMLVEAVVAAGGQLWVPASGGSMHPTIPAGARVRLGPLPARRLGPRDVVLARLRDGAVVLHRVRADRGDEIVLRGDANLREDPATPRAAILALADTVAVGGQLRAIGRWPDHALLRRIARIAARLTAPGSADA
ncbi:MAG TPA: nucleotidyltransferase family protein [Gemmatimonadaceae bacterium]|nr:nucleotidyltransferase family protein [Gemmatimonadaceae bacterium]